jgi:hypothetical protein
MSYLLRIVLPDWPGALGSVATALGKAGIDIIGLTIVERGTGGAVDDLLVTLPPHGLVDAVLTAVHSVPGAAVESLRPYPAEASGIHDDLELADVLADRPERAPAVLTEFVAGVFYADWAMMLEHLGSDDTRLRAASVGAPDLRGDGYDNTGKVRLAAPWMPLKQACSLGLDDGPFPRRWADLGMELAAAPVGRANLAVLLGRPGGPRFRPSEVARLAHLADIAAALASRTTAC